MIERRVLITFGVIIGAIIGLGLLFRILHDPADWTEVARTQSPSGVIAVLEQDLRIDGGPTAMRVVATAPDGSIETSKLFFVSNGGERLAPTDCVLGWMEDELLVTCDGSLQDPATRSFDVAR